MKYLLNVYQPDGPPPAEVDLAVVAMNRAVAVAEVHGPGVALALLDELELDGYHLYHAIRAELLRRLGRTDEADLAYRAALTHTRNAAERELLTRDRAALPKG